MKLFKIAFIILLSTNNIILHSFPFQTTRIEGPPLDIQHRNPNGGPENGIRQITGEECRKTVSQWMRTNNVASGSGHSIELLELLLTLDVFAQAMPGLRPRRSELIAFGVIVDGYIECIAAVCWKKKIFPNEFEVVSISQRKTPSIVNTEEHINAIITFILELCKDNAILEDSEPLMKYDFFKLNKKLVAFFNKPSSKLSDASKVRKSSSTLSQQDQLKTSDQYQLELDEESIINRYKSVNISPCVYLGSSAPASNVVLPEYWYRTKLHIPFEEQNNPIETAGNSNKLEMVDKPCIFLYFRPKKSREMEYEIRFQKPEVGTRAGSGTVGNPLIISLEVVEEPTESIESKEEGLQRLSGSTIIRRLTLVPLPNNTKLCKDAIFQVAEAIKAKIIHPKLNQ